MPSLALYASWCRKDSSIACCLSCSFNRSGQSGLESSFVESPSFDRPVSEAILIDGGRFGRRRIRILGDRNRHRDICGCTSGEAKHRFRYQSYRWWRATNSPVGATRVNRKSPLQLCETRRLALRDRLDLVYEISSARPCRAPGQQRTWCGGSRSSWMFGQSVEPFYGCDTSACLSTQLTNH